MNYCGVIISLIYDIYKDLICLKFTNIEIISMQYLQSKKTYFFYLKGHFILVFVTLASIFKNVNCYSTLVPLAGGHGEMYGRSFPNREYFDVEKR